MFGKKKAKETSGDGAYKVVTVLEDLEKFEMIVSGLLDSGDWKLAGGVSVTQLDLLPLYSQALTKVAE